LLREPLNVLAVEAVGPYWLLRLGRGRLDPGVPGQFFMLRPPGRVLPRPMSLCLAPPGELVFLVDIVGPGTRALVEAEPGERIDALGPLGRGYRLDVERPVLVGGGVGIAPLPYLASWVPRAPAVLGFRSPRHAEAAALLPQAEVVVEPRLVTDALPPDQDVLACGPEPMLHAVAALAPDAQLAWEAPMACGFGACYGCVVEIEGRLKRLCLEGPVVSGHAMKGHEGGRRSVVSGEDMAGAEIALAGVGSRHGHDLRRHVGPPSPHMAGRDEAA
jgi:dihydroorotate dehydrogenase electron transfer subunit